MKNEMRDRVRAILANGRPKRPRIEAAADEATVYVYDYIGWLGVEAEPLARQIAALDVSTIHVRINSPGGDVFEARAINQALRQHPAKVIVHVDGLAASAASVIAMVGDEVRMADGSFMMIHNPWWLAIGDATELREAADVLEKVQDSIRDTYARKSGLGPDEIQQMMDEETWLDADEAVERGFADVSESAAAGEPSARFDLSIFDHAPEKIAAQSGENVLRSRPPTEREAERALRDAGFSNSAAKAIIAGGFKATPEPRDEDGKARLKAALRKRGTALETV